MGQVQVAQQDSFVDGDGPHAGVVAEEVGADDRARMVARFGHRLFDEVGFVEIVRVQQADEIAPRRRDALVHRAVDAAVGLRDDIGQVVGIRAQDVQRGRVAAAVDDDVLDMGPGLGAHGLDTALQRMGVVEQGRHHRHQRPLGRVMARVMGRACRVEAGARLKPAGAGHVGQAVEQPRPKARGLPVEPAVRRQRPRRVADRRGALQSRQPGAQPGQRAAAAVIGARVGQGAGHVASSVLGCGAGLSSPP